MTSWRTWSGRWAVVLAGAALAVAPAAAQACDDDEKEKGAPQAQVQGRWEDEGGRQAYLKSVERLGSDEEQARGLLRLMVEAPISEQTGAGILEVASRMKSDRPLLKVLSFFHRIQESELVRGPLARRYLETAARLQSQEALARALAEELHPQAIPESEVSRALELSQRIGSDDGLAKVLREVTDHQAITADIEGKLRAVAQRISSPELRQRVLEDLEQARSGGGDRHVRVEARMPRFAFRFGDQGTLLPPAPPAPPAPPTPPAAVLPPEPPESMTMFPRDGEVIVNGHRHELSREQREAIKESARRIREQAKEMKKHLKEQMKELRRHLREESRKDDRRQDIEDFEIDFGFDE